MKIGFPLLNSKELAPDFAHCNHIAIYNSLNDKINIISLNHSDLAEQNSFQVLVKNGLRAVVSPFYSFMSLRVFKENKITTYKAKGKLIDKNIEFYKTDKLKAFDIYDALLTGECAKDCLSCDPDYDCEEE